MHGAVEIDGGHALAVGGDDVFDEGGVFDIGGAFIVNDDVVSLGPFRIFVFFKAEAGAAIGGVKDVDGQVGACFQTGFEDFFLFGVIVAASADDEQGAQGFGDAGAFSGAQAEADGGGEDGQTGE